VCFAIWLGAPAGAADAVTLRVALYPFVPNQYAVFALLAREFQRKELRENNQPVTLDLVEIDPMKDYYDDGLLTLQADVYEIDSILLSDMIAANKVAPLNVSLTNFPPEAVEAVTRQDTIYAVPHWLCGNFLFYRKGDMAIRDAETWDQLLAELKRRRKPLLVDFFGRLTLGEWYITMLADRIGVAAAQDAVIASDKPDESVVADLRSILEACPTGYCRSRDMHERTGYYARAFIRGEAAAYIGYSESLHFGLQEAINNCVIGSACLLTDEIAVRSLPKLAVNGSSAGIGWVDGLAISPDLAGAKKDLALRFLAFATSEAGYQAVLAPQWMEAPRYLLPARLGVQISNAPLYPDLLAAHAGRKTGTLPELNAKLRALASHLNCNLPADRTDTKTLASCKIQ